MLLGIETAQGQVRSTLPYSTRTKPYAGYSTGARGDIRTVGMAGATVGLADTFIAAIDNPAGLAMTLDNADSHYTENFVHDEHIQDYNSILQTSSAGVAAAFYPWAFSLGYISPYRENQSYELTAAPGDPAELDLITRELHLGVARTMLNNRFSVGFDLKLAQATVASTYSQNPWLSTRHRDATIGGTVGGMVQLPARFLLGMSYSAPHEYNFNPRSDQSPGFPGFVQPIKVPGVYGLGLGWIPNRFFRVDVTSKFIRATRGTALLRDESRAVGSRAVVEPKLGVAYVFADFKDFKATLFLGSYFEHSRIADVGSRVHKTAGMEIKPWIVTAGWGIDSAPGYKNYLVSVGIDIFKVMSKTEIIPTPHQSPYGRLFPHPLVLSDEGLARPLVKDWQPRGPDLNPIKVGLDIPRKLQEKVEKTGKEIRELLAPTPKPKPRPRHSPGPKIREKI